MGRTTTVQTNFTTGELAPEVLGRVDVQQYNNGAKQLTNCFVVVQGGVYSRVGTTFTAVTKNSAKRSRVVPFVKTKLTRYVIEMGDLYLRYFKDGVAVGGPYETVSPYTEAQIGAVDYVQDADLMYLAHEAVPIQRLRRFADANWNLAPAPFTAQPFAEVGQRPAVALTLSTLSVGAGRTVTAGSAVFLAADVGRAILCGPGIAVITGYTSTTVVTAEITIAFDSVNILASTWVLDASPQTTCTPAVAGPVGTVTTLTLGAAGWRSNEVNGFVRINGGLLLITQFTSTTVVSARILTELTSATAAPALAWSVETTQWSAANGYPRTITMFQQRLVCAGSTAYPQTVWGSRIAEPLDFTLGTNDDEGFAFTIGSDENNQIAWISAGRDLLAMTYGAEYALRGGVEKPITPTNVSIVPQTDHGASAARPVSVRKETVFVQASGKKLRGMTFNYNSDGYDAPDLLALAEHLTQQEEDGTQLEIIEAAFQKEPYSLLWAVRSDGALLSCALDRTQVVSGWSRHDVGGVVESVCCVPGAGADVVYLVVKRTVNAAVVRYIERMDFATEDTHLSARNLMQVDCGITLYNGAGSLTWTHPGLPGTEVAVLADGLYVGLYTTNGSGQITLGRTAYSVQMGLPFTATVVPVTPVADTGSGPSVGQTMSTSHVWLQVLRSGPMWCNGELIPFANFGDELLDQPQKLFTGFFDVAAEGWYDGVSDITLERRLPFPMKLLSIARTFTANAG
jgi:hypothetical protein